MKKLIAAVLAVILTVCVSAGCAGSGAETEAGKTDRALIKVGFSQLGSESDWRLANTESMQKTFTEENGYDLIFDNARQIQENQLVAVRDFIQQGVDYIVIAPIKETGWDGVLKETQKRGIPVIIVDRQVDADESLYTCWVGSDFRQEGDTAVEWLEEKYPDKELKILHLRGTDQSSAQLGRTEALLDAAAAHQDWDVIATLNGDFTKALGYEVVRDYLNSNPNADFNVLYCENDNMCFGALEALDEAGITHGTNGKVTVISFDAVKQALELCLAGQIDFCVECNPLHGRKVKEIIEALEAGETVEKQNNTVLELSFASDTLTQALIDNRMY